MIEWLKNFFSRTEEPDIGLGSSIYSNWTIQPTSYWMDHFGVESEAQANGAMDLPPSNSSNPDQFHAHVKTEFDRFKSTKKNEIDRQVQSLESTLGRLDDNKNTFSQHEEKYKNKIKNIQQEFETRIKNASEDVKASKADLNNFKRNNKLTRPAQPQSSSFLFIMILIVVLIFETILNGIFLGENLIGSSFAGMTWALAFSIVNVSLGVILAPLIRNINHINAGIKIFGYFIGLLWLSIVTLINLLIGHFRDAVTLPEGQGLDDVYKAIDAMCFNPDVACSSPFVLGEPVSYFLVALGIICALVALLDSFFHNDTYPGYGKKSAELEAFEENLLSLKSEINSEQENLYSSFVKDGNKLISSVSAHITNLQQTIGFIELRINEEYGDYFENLSGSFKAVIDQYRTSNIEARDSEPPKYFQDSVQFSWRALETQTNMMQKESENFLVVKTSAESLLESWPDTQLKIRNLQKEY